MKLNEIEKQFLVGYGEYCKKLPMIETRCNKVQIIPRLQGSDAFSAFDTKVIHVSGDDKFSEDTQMGIYPQQEIGRYRPDFILAGNVKIIGFSVGIEIDGHDWHEKTVKQATHDKKRERDLLCSGIFTVRFSGTEVKRNPELCAHEAIKCFLSIWESIIIATTEDE